MEATAKIDPVRYGVMYEKVRELDKKVDKIETQVEQLVEFSNKIKGAWVTAVLAMSLLSSVIGFVLHKFWGWKCPGSTESFISLYHY